MATINLVGNGLSGATGTGSFVGSTSPTLVTPALGTPSSGTLTNCTGLPVAGGGTGLSSTTAYAVLCGGTTSTSALQSVASVGTSGQALRSNGSGALPTFQTAPCFRARCTTTQTFGASGYTKVQCNTEDFDTTSAYDNATNYRFTPQVPGKYLFVGTCSVTSMPDGKQIGVVFYKNGAAERFNGLYNGATAALQVNGAAIIELNGSTDYVELYVWNGDTASKTNETAASYFNSMFSGAFLG